MSLYILYVCDLVCMYESDFKWDPKNPQLMWPSYVCIYVYDYIYVCMSVFVCKCSPWVSRSEEGSPHKLIKQDINTGESVELGGF